MFGTRKTEEIASTQKWDAPPTVSQARFLLPASSDFFGDHVSANSWISSCIVSIEEFAICLTVAVCAAFVFFLKRAQIRRSIRVPGQVIEHLRVEYSNHKGHQKIRVDLRIAYRLASGLSSEFVSSDSHSPLPKVGETVTVLYDPKDPSEVRIENRKFRHWEESIVFAISMFGVWMYFYDRIVR